MHLELPHISEKALSKLSWIMVLSVGNNADTDSWCSYKAGADTYNIDRVYVWRGRERNRIFFLKATEW